MKSQGSQTRGVSAGEGSRSNAFEDAPARRDVQVGSNWSKRDFRRFSGHAELVGQRGHLLRMGPCRREEATATGFRMGVG